jgi:hypothetical protein
MLFYVATYPRCGSGVIRNALSRNFGMPVSNGYAAVTDRQPTADPDLDRAVGHPMVKEPALERLTPEVRERLAALPDRLFVKTHERPFDAWFPGEHAIQMVRHPGAAIVSHQRLSGKRSLDDHIGGKCYAGSWSAYHRAWREAAVPTCRLRYEDVYAQPDLLLRGLERFTGLPIVDRHVETAAEATARNPERNPGLGLDGWRSLVSDEQRRAIVETHGPEAAEHGYDLG